MQATQWLAGTSVDLSKTLTLETTAFYTRSSDLSVRNPRLSPSVAEGLLQNGEGRAYGAQFLVRRELANRLFGWVAYTLLRSERKDTPDGDWRPFDFDQTHVLTALASYDFGAGFEIGARFRYSTGYPRTPVTGAYYDSRSDTYQPILGTKNADRLPDFWQLDVRLAKEFKIGTTRLEVYLDVQNVTDRDNSEEVVYSQDYTEKRYIQGLPILPVLGARWEF
jgi:hypothetical protein